MSELRYKMFFNNKPATEAQLGRIKKITIDQEINMAWEARVEIPIFVDNKGKWSGEDEEFMKPYSQVRIEIKIGNGSHIPLIDGPIVGFDSPMSSQPGESTIILIVHDDSAHLNRMEKTTRFENKKIEEIAQQIFNESDHISTTDIYGNQSNLVLPFVIQRGTDIQILRSLARQHGLYAYVLPGDTPGKSIGCFKPLPTKPTGIQPLILIGEKRNITEFNIRNEAHRPSSFTASKINTFDKSVITATSSYREAQMMGSDFVQAGEATQTTQRLRNDEVGIENLNQIVLARASDSSFSVEATGRVNKCYGEVLLPYNVVTVLGANGRSSGDYLISKVTHILTNSGYSQSFTVKRNSRSAGTGGGGSTNNCGCSGGITGAITGSLALEVGIF